MTEWQLEIVLRSQYLKQKDEWLYFWLDKLYATYVTKNNGPLCYERLPSHLE